MMMMMVNSFMALEVVTIQIAFGRVLCLEYERLL